MLKYISDTHTRTGFQHELILTYCSLSFPLLDLLLSTCERTSCQANAIERIQICNQHSFLSPPLVRKEERELQSKQQLKVILIFLKFSLWFPQEKLLRGRAYQNELLIMHVQRDGWAPKPQHSPYCACPSSAVSLHPLI